MSNITGRHHLGLSRYLGHSPHQRRQDLNMGIDNIETASQINGICVEVEKREPAPDVGFGPDLEDTLQAANGC